jgi:hypothetical protein
VRRGQVQRQLPVLHLSFKGQGNELLLGDAASSEKPLVWRRASL